MNRVSAIIAVNQTKNSLTNRLSYTPPAPPPDNVRFFTSIDEINAMNTKLTNGVFKNYNDYDTDSPNEGASYLATISALTTSGSIYGNSYSPAIYDLSSDVYDLYPLVQTAIIPNVNNTLGNTLGAKFKHLDTSLHYALTGITAYGTAVLEFLKYQCASANFDFSNRTRFPVRGGFMGTGEDFVWAAYMLGLFRSYDNVRNLATTADKNIIESCFFNFGVWFLDCCCVPYMNDVWGSNWQSDTWVYNTGLGTAIEGYMYKRYDTPSNTLIDTAPCRFWVQTYRFNNRVLALWLFSSAFSSWTNLITHSMDATRTGSSITTVGQINTKLSEMRVMVEAYYKGFMRYGVFGNHLITDMFRSKDNPSGSEVNWATASKGRYYSFQCIGSLVAGNEFRYRGGLSHFFQYFTGQGYLDSIADATVTGSEPLVYDATTGLYRTNTNKNVKCLFNIIKNYCKHARQDGFALGTMYGTHSSITVATRNNYVISQEAVEKTSPFQKFSYHLQLGWALQFANYWQNIDTTQAQYIEDTALMIPATLSFPRSTARGGQYSTLFGSGSGESRRGMHETGNVVYLKYALIRNTVANIFKTA